MKSLLMMVRIAWVASVKVVVVVVVVFVFVVVVVVLCRFCVANASPRVARARGAATRPISARGAWGPRATRHPAGKSISEQTGYGEVADVEPNRGTSQNRGGG